VGDGQDVDAAALDVLARDRGEAVEPVGERARDAGTAAAH
jgi:hypothetical protein